MVCDRNKRHKACTLYGLNIDVTKDIKIYSFTISLEILVNVKPLSELWIVYKIILVHCFSNYH